MQKNKSHWNRIAFALFLVIASSSAGIFISRRAAIQNAIQQCDSFDLRAEEQPSAIKTRINTYKGAPTEPLSIVWVVDMKGKWIPLPKEGQPGQAPQYFDRCAVTVDVLTGDVMELRNYLKR